MNTCHLIDNMEFMKTVPDNHYDLAIVDPPYGIGAGKEKEHNGWNSYGIKQWDNAPPEKQYFEELFRISKNQIVWGANHFISIIPFNFSCFLIWDKGQRNFSLADGELAWTSFNTSARFFTYSRAMALQEGKIHPTQKPVALYKWLLKNYAKPNDTIFDSHVGSGSIRIACHDMGFSFTGCEIDLDYFNAQEKRFQNHIKQNDLFAPKEIQKEMLQPSLIDKQECIG
jgi:site-specific DNA-methyltransferase (adenine-specific)